MERPKSSSANYDLLHHDVKNRPLMNPTSCIDNRQVMVEGNGIVRDTILSEMFTPSMAHQITLCKLISFSIQFVWYSPSISQHTFVCCDLVNLFGKFNAVLYLRQAYLWKPTARLYKFYIKFLTLSINFMETHPIFQSTTNCMKLC